MSSYFIRKRFWRRWIGLIKNQRNLNQEKGLRHHDKFFSPIKKTNRDFLIRSDSKTGIDRLKWKPFSKKIESWTISKNYSKGI